MQGQYCSITTSTIRSRTMADFCDKVRGWCICTRRCANAALEHQKQNRSYVIHLTQAYGLSYALPAGYKLSGRALGPVQLVLSPPFANHTPPLTLAKCEFVWIYHRQSSGTDTSHDRPKEAKEPLFCCGTSHKSANYHKRTAHQQHTKIYFKGYPEAGFILRRNPITTLFHCPKCNKSWAMATPIRVSGGASMTRRMR